LEAGKKIPRKERTRVVDIKKNVKRPVWMRGKGYEKKESHRQVSEGEH